MPDDPSPKPSAPRRGHSRAVNVAIRPATAEDVDLPDRPADGLPINVVLRGEDNPVSFLVDEIGEVIAWRNAFWALSDAMAKSAVPWNDMVRPSAQFAGAYRVLNQEAMPKIKNIIEQMNSLKADEATVRALSRMLDEIKAGAQGLSLGGIADTAGLMSTMSRRGGGQQMKVRGLRELLGSLQTNYDGALRAATTEERSAEA